MTIFEVSRNGQNDENGIFEVSRNGQNDIFEVAHFIMYIHIGKTMPIYNTIVEITCEVWHVLLIILWICLVLLYYVVFSPIFVVGFCIDHSDYGHEMSPNIDNITLRMDHIPSEKP